MQYIDTRGTWRQMGEQLGEQMRDLLRRAMETYTPDLTANLSRYDAPLARLRSMLERHCPQLLDETAGMAAGMGQPEPAVLGFRFFADLMSWGQKGCSTFYLRDSDAGPILARTADLSIRTNDAEFQLCQLLRPTGERAAITTTYAGMAARQGMNDAGLGAGGTSVAILPTAGEHDDAVTIAVYLNRMLHGHATVREAVAYVNERPFTGKPGNLLLGDAMGDSALLEYSRGVPPRVVERGGRTWQGCTNFLVSNQAKIRATAENLGNSYARFGCIVHAMEHQAPPRDAAGVEALLRQIAQPGPVVDHPRLRTAYAQIMLLEQRVMRVSFGHPAETPFREIAFG